MIKPVLRIGALALLAAALAGAPAQLVAQTTNNPAAAKKDGAKKSTGAHPFHGKLAAVDKIAKTIKVGKSVYQITSESKITKDGKPAVLEDGVVGEPVTGYVKPAADGKMVVRTVHFGAKTAAKGGSKKKEK